MGKPVQELRAIKITIRLTEAERDFLVSEADVCSLSVSSFIRRRSLGKRIVPRTELRVLAELRRLGGLLKHLHNETRGTYSALTANCLNEIATYIRLMNKNAGEGNRFP